MRFTTGEVKADIEALLFTEIAWEPCRMYPARP